MISIYRILCHFFKGSNFPFLLPKYGRRWWPQCKDLTGKLFLWYLFSTVVRHLGDKKTFGLDVIKNNFRAIGRKIVSFCNNNSHRFLGHRLFSRKIPFLPSFFSIHGHIAKKKKKKTRNISFIFKQYAKLKRRKDRNSLGVRTPEPQAQIYFCLRDDL